MDECWINEMYVCVCVCVCVSICLSHGATINFFFCVIKKCCTVLCLVCKKRKRTLRHTYCFFYFFFTVLHHIDVACMQYLPSKVMVEIFDKLLFMYSCFAMAFFSSVDVFHKLISYFSSC
jgi:hypothetical protein